MPKRPPPKAPKEFNISPDDHAALSRSLLGEKAELLVERLAGLSHRQRIMTLMPYVHSFHMLKAKGHVMDVDDMCPVILRPGEELTGKDPQGEHH